MKLLKFPYYVQTEILDNIEHSNLFWLSFVSKNIKSLIKSSQAKRFRSISRIVYESFRDKPIVSIHFKTKNKEGTKDVLKKENIIGVFGVYREYESDCFQLNVAGKMIDFRMSHYYSFPEACFHRHDKESVIESIHNYVFDFFGDTVEHIWEASFPELFIPDLPNLSLWITIWSEDWEIIDRKRDLKNREKFFASIPVLKNITMDTSEPFSPESKFYQAESIRIFQSHYPSVQAFLRNFKGRQATLSHCQCDFMELMMFMNRWRSGEAFQNVEYLKIELYGGRLQNQVLNVNWVKHIDATKTPPTHSVLDLSAPDPALKPNTDPIASHSYIVREADSRVASVSVQGQTFSFGVWKETEEQFLRMVK
ncbi:hypothetical protein B9Z55_009173 [Caenorhabditis nigoni]|nr:hypothetical protein B9Z55_009173 [Caenorhabditis nigoni]